MPRNVNGTLVLAVMVHSPSLLVAENTLSDFRIIGRYAFRFLASVEDHSLLTGIPSLLWLVVHASNPALDEIDRFFIG